MLEHYYRDDQQKRVFVRSLFNRAAGDYDHAERIMAMGSGSWYRRKALERAGLKRGMYMLDVATGTGLVARQAIAILGDVTRVVGLDPTPGMLAQARRQLGIPAVLASGEQIPMPDDTFDFLCMGYALRHLSDLIVTFKEFHRVLKPGSTVCVLELTQPSGRIRRGLLKFYIRGIIPVLSRLTCRGRNVADLWQYYWETIAVCVPPQKVIEALCAAGFVDVKRHVELGMFSEYTARKA